MAHIPKNLEDAEAGSLFRSGLEHAPQDDAAVADPGGRARVLVARLLQGLVFRGKGVLDDPGAEFFKIGSRGDAGKKLRIGSLQIRSG